MRLNSPQQQAVMSPDPNLLIIAGAGSGKTRVLVERMAFLMRDQDLSPYALMAVTFTNKAAAELRARTESLLNMSARSMWVGTFHCLAHRWLRMHWSEAKLPQNFQILDSDDQIVDFFRADGFIGKIVGNLVVGQVALRFTFGNQLF